MKITRTLLISLVATVQLVTAAAAASVNLAWNANIEPDIAGYKLYYGTTSHQYTQVINVGNFLTKTVNNLLEGETYFFAVTAYNHQQMESGFSPEAQYEVPLIEGAIRFCNSNLPVVGITVVATGPVTQTTVTDSNGGYRFFLPPGTYTVTPIPPPRLTPGSPGINTADVIAIQQTALGLLIPMCSEATNVNGDHRTDTVDVIATQQFVLGFNAANVGVFGFRVVTPYYFKMYCRGDAVTSNMRPTSPLVLR